MLYRHLIEGSIYVMLPIYILWIVNILLICGLFYRLLIRKNIDKLKAKSLSELILFTGSFTFLWGVLWQVIGLLEALKSIELAGGISPYLIAQAFRITLTGSTYGLLLLIVSYTVWFISRKTIK